MSFEINQRVMVPWGFGEMEGVVVDSFGPAHDPIVSVRISFGETEDGEVLWSDIGFSGKDVLPVPSPSAS